MPPTVNGVYPGLNKTSGSTSYITVKGTELTQGLSATVSNGTLTWTGTVVWVTNGQDFGILQLTPSPATAAVPSLPDILRYFTITVEGAQPYQEAQIDVYDDTNLTAEGDPAPRPTGG